MTKLIQMNISKGKIVYPYQSNHHESLESIESIESLESIESIESIESLECVKAINDDNKMNINKQDTKYKQLKISKGRLENSESFSSRK